MLIVVVSVMVLYCGVFSACVTVVIGVYISVCWDLCYLVIFFVCTEPTEIYPELIVGSGGSFLWLELGVCVGGPSCASNLVCVWGGLLVIHRMRLCAGAYLCLILAGPGGREPCSSRLLCACAEVHMLAPLCV